MLKPLRHAIFLQVCEKGPATPVASSMNTLPVINSGDRESMDLPNLLPCRPNPPRPPASSVLARLARMIDTKKVIHAPAICFDVEWSAAAKSICDEWQQTQTSRGQMQQSPQAYIAVSRMKALEFERKHLAHLPHDRLILPPGSTRQNYYDAEIAAFLEAIGTTDVLAVLDSFRLAGTGGLHRQSSMFAATVSNPLGAAQLIAPDLAVKAGLSSARLAMQAVTGGAILQAGQHRLRNAGTEDVLPLGRADATPAAKNAPNVLQASSRVIHQLRGAEKNLHALQTALRRFNELKSASVADDARLSDATEKLALAFAKISHQLSIKTAYKASSENAKVEFWGNQRYLLISYGGTSVTLAASLVAIMTPALIAAPVTGGLSLAATALAISLYLGYQLSEGPSKDGEAKARRAIVAAVKLLEVLSGERSTYVLQRAQIYQNYLTQNKSNRFASSEKKSARKQVAKKRMLAQLEHLAHNSPQRRDEKNSDHKADFRPRQNWDAYRSYLDQCAAIGAHAQQGQLDQSQYQQQISALNQRFSTEHKTHFALDEIVGIWKTPISMRMVAARRLLKGKVARSQQRLLHLQRRSTLNASANSKTKKEKITRLRSELRQQLCDLFNFELALQDMAGVDEKNPSTQAQARAIDRLGEVVDDDVRQLFCGDGRAQVDAVNKSKKLAAGEAQRYTYANAGSAALGIAVNVAVSATDTAVAFQKADGIYAGPQFNDYKFLALSQGQAQPGAHLSVGDRAAFQQREMQPLLKKIARSGDTFELDCQLPASANGRLQKNDPVVIARLNALIDSLCKSSSVPDSIQLSLHTPASATSGVSEAPAQSSPQLQPTAKPSRSALQDVRLTIEFKTTSAYHEVKYKKSTAPKRAKFIAGQLGIGARQALMSVAGLPAQAIAQHRLSQTRSALNTAEAMTEQVDALLRGSMRPPSPIRATAPTTPSIAQSGPLSPAQATSQTLSISSKYKCNPDHNSLRAQRVWRRLQAAEAARSPVPEAKKFIDAVFVPPNSTGLLCKNNQQVVKVQGSPIHAHRIRTITTAEDSSGAKDASTFVAGQSPEAAQLDHFLLQGIESRNGIFQFVSRKAHYRQETSTQLPVIAQLQKRLHDPATLIGGRYRIHPGSAPQENHPDSGDDYRRFMLVVTDTKSTEIPAPTIQIPITQAGLKFTDRVLDAQHIGRASKLLRDHIACLTVHSTAAVEVARSINLDQMVLSRAGIGRNATLISYRLIQDQLARKDSPTAKNLDEQVALNNDGDENDSKNDDASSNSDILDNRIDEVLFNVIYAGRGDRDSAYLPSLRQLTELRMALLQTT